MAENCSDRKFEHCTGISGMFSFDDDIGLECDDCEGCYYSRAMRLKREEIQTQLDQDFAKRRDEEMEKCYQEMFGKTRGGIYLR